MKKKIVSCILVLAMLFACVLSLASCFGNDLSYFANDFEIPEGGYDGNPVEITMYHCSGKTLLSVLEKYVAKFNELYPNIKITLTSQGDYDGVRDIISTKLTAGEQPDIAYCYPDHVASYNSAKAVISLNSLIASDIEVTDSKGNTTILGLTEDQINDFIPQYYEEGMAFDDAGTMYTLPMAKSTEALYYNKSFFDKYSIPVPTTWDEMEAVCERIKEIDPDCIPLGYDSEANWFITMCAQLGSPYTSLDSSNHFQFDNETNRAFVERFSEWYQKGYVTTKELNKGYTSDLFTEIQEDKLKCYMVIGSTGGASYQNPPVVDSSSNDPATKYAFEIGVVSIPQINTESPKAISQGPSLCIFKQGDPQRTVASWLFVKYLATNAQFQAEFSQKSGYSPVINSARELQQYKDWLAVANGYDNLQALGVGLCNDTTHYVFVSDAFNGSSKARDTVGIIMQGALGYTGTDIKSKIDELFKKAIADCQYAIR